MAVLTLSEIDTLAKNRLAINTSVNAPLDDAARDNFYNDAYADVWEVTGLSVKRANSATAWATSPLTGLGEYTAGLLTDVKEILRVFRSITVGSTGLTLGDVELERAELTELMQRRQTTTAPYQVPVIYALERLDPGTTDADVNKLALHVWPRLALGTTFYFPIHYVKQFAPLVRASSPLTPDVTDKESRDIALIAAARMAQVLGRTDLVPGLLMDVSERTAVAMERKFRAMLSPKARMGEATA